MPAPSDPAALPGELELEVVRAFDLPDAAREAALERLCMEHPDRAQAIRGYAAAAEDVALAFRAIPKPLGDDGPPAAIGPYRILGVLGQGGMGTVYLAEQHEPVQRKVALKVIKLGMDSAQILARFETERRTLAAMSHDHIAKVYDAGLTERGQPYFAMEYVEGLPIDRHCDQARLSTRQRLGLFLQVCEGVQHAHQKGVIHRDLKPSNILVSVQGQRAVPKIIDFGLARATERDGEPSYATIEGQLVGTPGYMSPEQAAGETAALDTRTDVFSLGVVLYELLVGALPVDPRSPLTIEARDPARPSTRLSQMGPAASDVAARRGTEPRALSRALRGDLDWITLTALEPDRQRRYRGVAELADDLRRHLADEPVLAAAPGRAYRARKFVRRNRVAVVTGVLVLAALVAGLVGTLWQAGIAEQHLAEARAALRTARTVNDFLTLDLLEASRPEQALGREVTVEEVLRRAALQVGSRFADEPEVQAAVRHALGESFARLGLFDEARAHHETALALRREALGPEHRDTLASERAMAGIRLGLGDAPAAESALRRVLEASQLRLGAEDEDTLATRLQLGRLLRSTGRGEDAVREYRDVLAVCERTLGERHEKTMHTLELLGQILADLEQFDEAEQLMRRVLALRREQSGEIHPRTLAVMNNLANLHHDRGEFTKAEPLYRDALAATERIFGEDHLEYALVLNNQASLLQDMTRADPAVDRLAEAEQMFRRALAIRLAVRGPQHREVASAYNNLALVLVDRGSYEEAEEMMQEVLAIQERQPELTRRERVITRFNIASIAGWRDDDERSARLFAELLPDAEEVFGPTNSHVARLRLAHGIALQFLGRFGEAEEQFLRAHSIAAAAFGERARFTVEVIEKTRNFYRAWHQSADADKQAELGAWEGKLQSATTAQAGQ